MCQAFSVSHMFVSINAPICQAAIRNLMNNACACAMCRYNIQVENGMINAFKFLPMICAKSDGEVSHLCVFTIGFQCKAFYCIILNEFTQKVHFKTFFMNIL